jgi:hypothetical protein
MTNSKHNRQKMLDAYVMRGMSCPLGMVADFKKDFKKDYQPSQGAKITFFLLTGKKYEQIKI